MKNLLTIFVVMRFLVLRFFYMNVGYFLTFLAH